MGLETLKSAERAAGFAMAALDDLPTESICEVKQDAPGWAPAGPLLVPRQAAAGNATRTKTAWTKTAWTKTAGSKTTGSKTAWAKTARTKTAHAKTTPSAAEWLRGLFGLSSGRRAPA